MTVLTLALGVALGIILGNVTLSFATALIEKRVLKKRLTKIAEGLQRIEDEGAKAKPHGPDGHYL